ncbi:MAG: hypothetical protein IJG65_09845 [Synergistaceae bacterium]|nr:hypothetical protein [Synergistaceae bacterium]
MSFAFTSEPASMSAWNASGLFLNPAAKTSAVFPSSFVALRSAPALMNS